MEQIIIDSKEDYKGLDDYLVNTNVRKIFLVCGNSINSLNIGAYFSSLEKRMGILVTRFSDFSANPDYESVVRGVRIFNEEKSDVIVAVGGGSAIDVAKCIKLYSNMDHTTNYLNQSIIKNNISLLAIPTTAGTGSESTKFAVIYYNGEKQSVTDISCIPRAILLDPSALNTLPDYQRKVTMLDALCHAIESFWSINSTEESQKFSFDAIRMIIDNMDEYLNNTFAGNSAMLKAANISGKAINITQTTAGHAMCYKLTSMYGIAHGHAAAICVSKLFPYMVNNLDFCTDPRGKKYLEKVFEKIADAMRCDSISDTIVKFDIIIQKLDLGCPIAKDEDYTVLSNSVNPVRLNNNPVGLTFDSINMLYHQILTQQ